MIFTSCIIRFKIHDGEVESIATHSRVCAFVPVCAAKLSATASNQSLPRCHEEEKSALLEFKQSYIDQDDPLFVSWNPAEGGEGGNCCSWLGVQCDHDSGHVIGLDLSNPRRATLVSSINSTNSLFQLTYLEKLDLSGINFHYSPIPSAISNFSRLKVLNLSSCDFTGQVPPEILGLTNLSSLDLSKNYLELEKPNMEDLARSLTKLEVLNLGWVDISAPLPNALANLTSLESLLLHDCGLQGNFPSFILKLPNLQVLDVSDNNDLLGELALPGITFAETGCASLKVFDVSHCNFSGPIDPTFSLGNCTQLTTLSLGGNRFHGKLPSFVNLNKLSVLDLSDNSLTGEIPSSYGNLTLLSELDLSFNAFTGEVSSSYGNLTLLSSLDVSSNRLTGQIPSSIGYLNRLSYLSLDNNSLTGLIPPSFGSLTGLHELHLSANQLTGPIPSFLGNLSQLQWLDLSSNRLTHPIPSSIGNLTQLSMLYLSSNQLNGTIPSSIGNLSILSVLDISSNWLVGQIPPSLWKLASIAGINLARNHLTGLANDSLVNLMRLTAIDLSFNNLHGPLPTPPISIEFYIISNNQLSGELPPLICNLSRLGLLDVANNNFGGMVPQCLTNSSKILQMLSLHDNNFSGSIPQSYTNLCALWMMDLSHNRLEGPLPPSLGNCANLRFLNFGSNLIHGTFPSWMGSLSELRILILESNAFHGEILEPKSESEFAKLHILDVSNNNFVGSLPFNCIKCWKGMRKLDGEKYYFGANLAINASVLFSMYNFSMTITNKGSLTTYIKIRSDLTVINFSSNNFSGEIPDTFGSLQGLHLLNLSNNLLTGHIPPVLSNLTQLEAMDLSRNMLSGNIPYQLTNLSFLEVFKVSYNQLTGAIPRGNQFNTFDNSSYIGNVGLCGDPLSKKCGEGHKETPPPAKDNKIDSNGLFELDWKIILMGFASGTIVGVVVGRGITIRRDNWFLRKFGRRDRRRRR